MQESYILLLNLDNQTSTPGVLQLLQFLDEMTGVGKKTDHLKLSNFWWPEICSALLSVISTTFLSETGKSWVLCLVPFDIIYFISLLKNSINTYPVKVDPPQKPKSTET